MEHRYGAVALAITLIIGIGVGAVGGFRLASTRADARAGASAEPAGRQYTDIALAGAPAHPAPRTAHPAPGTAHRALRTAHRAPDPPGSLVVVSRPAGARVTIDGRARGSTPLTVPSLSAGPHTIRISRYGYRPWVTDVRIEEGRRARVAASLVGGQAQE